MGVFVFSTFGSTFMFEYLHFPISLPEVFFIPLFIALKKHFTPVRIDQSTLLFLTVMLFFLIVLSQLRTTYALYDVLSSSRAYFYIFLFFSIYKKENRLSSDDLIYICLGTLIGWTLSSMKNLGAAMTDLSKFDAVYGNMIAAYIFISLTIMKKVWKLFAIGIIMVLFISFTVGLRRVIVIFLLALILPYLLMTLRRPKQLLKTVLFLVSFTFIVLMILPSIESKVESISPLLYNRIFVRAEMMMEGKEVAGDDVRKDNFHTLFDNMDEFFFPKGMVSNQSIKDNSVGVYTDFPLLALCHLFGWPIAFLIVCVFLIRSLKCVLYYLKIPDVDAGVFAMSGIIMLVLLFLEGTFINFPYAVPFTGLCLGRITYYSKKLRTVNRINWV